MRKRKASEAASILGKRSYRVRLERFGIERIREIARENGKKGGRPKNGESKRASSINRRREPSDDISAYPVQWEGLVQPQGA